MKTSTAIRRPRTRAVRLVRWALLGLVAVIAVVLAAPALGVQRDQIFPWLGGTPDPPVLDASQRERVAGFRMSDGNDVSFWLIPNASDGGAAPCVAERVTRSGTEDPPADAPQQAFANLGLDCTLGSTSQPAGVIQVVIDWLPASGSAWRRPLDGQYIALLHGRIPDGMNATEVELATASGSTVAQLSNGYFFARLPGASGIGTLAGSGLLEIIARDDTGAELQRVDLRKFLAASSP